MAPITPLLSKLNIPRPIKPLSLGMASFSSSSRHPPVCQHLAYSVAPGLAQGYFSLGRRGLPELKQTGGAPILPWIRTLSFYPDSPLLRHPSLLPPCHTAADSRLAPLHGRKGRKDQTEWRKTETDSPVLVEMCPLARAQSLDSPPPIHPPREEAVGFLVGLFQCGTGEFITLQREPHPDDLDMEVGM